MAEVCDDCGGTIRIGDWPYCGGDAAKHVQATNFGEDPLEPYVDDNLTTAVEGVTITTRGQRRKLMREHHLEYKPKRFDLLVGRRSYLFMGRG